MNFITRTRIIQIGDLVNGVQTALDPPTVFRTGPVGTVYLTMAEAMAAVPAGQRPPQSEWWKYQVQWLVQSHVLPTIRGVRPDTANLVFDVDFWLDAATQQAGNPPLRRNTFEYQIGKLSGRDIGADIRSQIDSYLMRAEFGDYPADGRDPSIPTTTDPAHDPKSLLTNTTLQGVNGVYRTLNPVWRG